MTADGSNTVTADRLSAAELRNLGAYWRACNYLAAGMIYLRANPLLREPLQPEHVKLRLFSDGCPGEESPAQAAARADRVVSRLRAVQGTCYCFPAGISFGCWPRAGSGSK